MLHTAVINYNKLSTITPFKNLKCITVQIRIIFNPNISSPGGYESLNIEALNNQNNEKNYIFQTPIYVLLGINVRINIT